MRQNLEYFHFYNQSMYKTYLNVSMIILYTKMGDLLDKNCLDINW